MGETTGREQFLGKYQGCLLGGAIGDALGYPVEFDSHDWIVRRFGPDGITAYASDEPVFSDDTQMTLFTAVGLLVGDTQAALAGHPGRLEDPCRYVNLAYLDWLATQHGVSRRTPHVSWIMGIPVLSCLVGKTAGQALAPYRGALLMVILGGGFYALLNLLYYILVIFGRQKQIFLIYCGTTLFAKLLSDYLVQRQGIPGAALSYLIAMAVLAGLFAAALVTGKITTTPGECR